MRLLALLPVLAQDIQPLTWKWEYRPLRSLGPLLEMGIKIVRRSEIRWFWLPEYALNTCCRRKKPTDFVPVTDLDGVLRTQSGFGVSAEVTSNILSKCSAFTFLHSVAAQTLCDNCPEEVPEFYGYCASHRSDIVGFPGIVVQGDSIMIMSDPSAVAVS